MFISRDEWGAKYGRGYPTAGAKLFLFVHHAAQRAPLRTMAAEAERWREYEQLHAERHTPTNPRIGYTAGITQSGNVLEGCGLGFVGAHTKNRNSSGWGVCFLMDGRFEQPTIAAIDAYYGWVREAVAKGFLSTNFAARGHRDVVDTTCPGDILYERLVRNGN